MSGKRALTEDRGQAKAMEIKRALDSGGISKSRIRSLYCALFHKTRISNFIQTCTAT